MPPSAAASGSAARRSSRSSPRVDLAPDLEPDDEEEDRHQAVVDPEVQVPLERAGPSWPMPSPTNCAWLEVARLAWNIGKSIALLALPDETVRREWKRFRLALSTSQAKSPAAAARSRCVSAPPPLAPALRRRARAPAAPSLPPPLKTNASVARGQPCARHAPTSPARRHRRTGGGWITGDWLKSAPSRRARGPTNRCCGRSVSLPRQGTQARALPRAAGGRRRPSFAGGHRGSGILNIVQRHG